MPMPLEIVKLLIHFASYASISVTYLNYFYLQARLYVLVEYLSQFYRSLAPVRQWLMFLFESYTGLEVVSVN